MSAYQRFVVNFASLARTPITGALINTYHSYTEGIIFGTSIMMAGAMIFTGARIAFAKDKLIAYEIQDCLRNVQSSSLG